MQAENLCKDEIGWFEIFIKLMYKAMKFCIKFSLYLCIRFLQMVIDFISNLLDFDNFLKQDQQDTEESLLEVEVIEDGNRHEYKLKRSKLYDSKYEDIEKLLKSTNGYDVCIEKSMAEDILKKINVLVFEAEKNALKEGYKFSRETRHELDEEDVYTNYIKSRVMRGE